MFFCDINTNFFSGMYRYMVSILPYIFFRSDDQSIDRQSEEEITSGSNKNINSSNLYERESFRNRLLGIGSSSEYEDISKETKSSKDLNNFYEVEWCFYLINTISFDFSQFDIRDSNNTSIKYVKIDSECAKVYNVDYMKKTYPSLDWIDNDKIFQEVRFRLLIDSKKRIDKFKLSYLGSDYKIKISLLKKSVTDKKWYFECNEGVNFIDINSISNESFSVLYFFEIILEKNTEAVITEENTIYFSQEDINETKENSRLNPEQLKTKNFYSNSLENINNEIFASEEISINLLQKENEKAVDEHISILEDQNTHTNSDLLMFEETNNIFTQEGNIEIVDENIANLERFEDYDSNTTGVDEQMMNLIKSTLFDEEDLSSDEINFEGHDQIKDMKHCDKYYDENNPENLLENKEIRKLFEHGEEESSKNKIEEENKRREELKKFKCKRLKPSDMIFKKNESSDTPKGPRQYSEVLKQPAIKYKKTKTNPTPRPYGRNLLNRPDRVLKTLDLRTSE